MAFCSNCGNEIEADTKFCPKCGNSVTNEQQMNSNSCSKENDQPNSVADSIWNPNAASNWSLLFSPAFGSYLQALNWRTLGMEKNANTSMRWFYASVGILFLGLVLNVSSPNNPNSAAGIGLLFLIVWYFVSGRKQNKYVKDNLGNQYRKRSWGKPFLIAVIAMIGYFALSIIALSATGINPLTASKGGYPKCTSEDAADQFKRVFDGSSFAGRMNLKVVDVTEQKKVSESSDGSKLTCQATLMLNSAKNISYQFTFTPAKDGTHFYVKGLPVR